MPFTRHTDHTLAQYVITGQPTENDLLKVIYDDGTFLYLRMYRMYDTDSRYEWILDARLMPSESRVAQVAGTTPLYVNNRRAIQVGGFAFAPRFCTRGGKAWIEASYLRHGVANFVPLTRDSLTPQATANLWVGWVREQV